MEPNTTENEKLTAEPAEETQAAAEETELSVQETELAAEKEEQEPGLNGWINSLPRRSVILMTVVGAYLLYLGYQLGRDVIKGAEGANVLFMIPAVLFVLFGVAGLYVGLKGYSRYDKEQRARWKEDAERARQEKEAKKKSISERASMDTHAGEDDTEEKP